MLKSLQSLLAFCRRNVGGLNTDAQIATGREREISSRASNGTIASEMTTSTTAIMAAAATMPKELYPPGVLLNAMLSAILAEGTSIGGLGIRGSSASLATDSVAEIEAAKFKAAQIETAQIGPSACLSDSLHSTRPKPINLLAAQLRSVAKLNRRAGKTPYRSAATDRSGPHRARTSPFKRPDSTSIQTRHTPRNFSAKKKSSQQRPAWLTARLTPSHQSTAQVLKFNPAAQAKERADSTRSTSGQQGIAA
jgi:hypothetical protein